jgi:uncharacterized membrane protein
MYCVGLSTISRLELTRCPRSPSIEGTLRRCLRPYDMIDLFVTLLLISTFLWFLFYLLNYAEITKVPATWVKEVLGKLSYPLSCAACWPFWVTLFGLVIYLDFMWWTCAVVPVIHLFIDLVYRKLAGGEK